MKNNIKPLGKRLVVERMQAETSKGGILLPETAKEKPRQGKVVAVGPEVEVEVGKQIFFSSYAGTEYKSDETEFLILSEDDVLAVVE